MSKRVLVAMSGGVDSAVAALVLTRPLAKKYINGKTQATNADRVIGTAAVVSELIDNIAGNTIDNKNLYINLTLLRLQKYKKKPEYLNRTPVEYTKKQFSSLRT